MSGTGRDEDWSLEDLVAELNRFADLDGPGWLEFHWFDGAEFDASNDRLVLRLRNRVNEARCKAVVSSGYVAEIARDTDVCDGSAAGVRGYILLLLDETVSTTHERFAEDVVLDDGLGE